MLIPNRPFCTVSTPRYGVCGLVGLFISGCGLYFNLMGLAQEGRFQLFHESDSLLKVPYL